MVDGSQSDGSHTSRMSRSDDGLFRLAFDATQTPMLCLDGDRRCQAINRAGAELLGIDGSLPTVAWEDVVSASDANRVSDWLISLQEQAATDCEFRLERKPGNEIVVCGRGHVQQSDRGDVVGYVVTLTEVTTEEATPAGGDTAGGDTAGGDTAGGDTAGSAAVDDPTAGGVAVVSRFEAEHRLLETVVSEIDLSKGLEHVIRFVEGQATGVVASIQLFSQGDENLRYGAAPSLSNEFNEAVSQLPIVERILSGGVVSARRKMVIVEDIESDSLWTGFCTIAQRENVRAYWSTPILDTRGSLLGTLAIYRRVSGGPTAADVSLIDAAARVTSILLTRARDSQLLDSVQEQLRMAEFSVEHCSTSVFWLRKDGSFLYANELALKAFRYSLDELLAMKFYELDPRHSAESWPDFWDQVSEQKTLAFQTEMKEQGGQLIPVEVTANYLEYEGQEFVFAFVTDFSNETDLYENSPYLMLSMDVRTGRIQQCNETMVRILGLSKSELLRTRVFDLLTPASHDKVQNEVFPGFLATGEVKDEAVQMVCADGSIRDFILSATALRGDAGEIVATRSVLRDVTEQKRIQSRLVESEALFRNLAETSSFGVQRNDVYGRITFANPALGQIYGCPPEVLIGTSVLDFAVNEQMRREMRGQLKQQLQDPLSTPPRYEMVHRTMDGRVVDLDIDWTVDRGVDGSIIGFIVVITDITERKRAERELAFRADVLDRVSDAIIVTDQQGNISYASEAARQFYHAEDLAGREWMLADRHRQLMAAANFGDEVRVILGEMGVWHGEHELTFEGKPYWLEIMLKSFASPSSGKRLLLTVIRDVSSRRMIEQENRRHRDLLAHVARLSTMGALVAGIAHEVKQPLYAISNYSTAVSVALRGIEEKQGGMTDQVAALNEFNEGVQSSAQRANEIIRRMRDFAKRGMGERAPVDLNKVAIDAVNLLSFKARDSGVDVQLKLMKGLPSVIADRIQCEQVVVNLLGNAYEALESIDGPRVVVVLTRCESNWIELEVRDNGPGIESADFGYLFDPFYTTKQDGMGMGLAISQTIVADHGGKLVARNGQVGTVFTLSLQNTGSKG